MKTIKKLKEGCGEWDSHEGFKGHTGGLPSCGEKNMLCDVCKIKLETVEEIVKVIEEEMFILKKEKKGIGLGKLLYSCKLKIKTLQKIINKIKGENGTS